MPSAYKFARGGSVPKDTSLVVFITGDSQKPGDKSSPIYTYV